MQKTIQKTAKFHLLKWLAIATMCLLLHGVALGQHPIQHGKIEGSTYVDGRFGLRYTFPSILEVQASLNGKPVGTGEKQGTSEFLFDAMEKPNGRIRRGVVITADPVGTLGMKDSLSFLRLMVAPLAPKGPPPDISKVTIAGRTFYESKAGGSASVPGGTATFFGAQVATDCNGYFLIFCFSAASQAEVADMLHSMDRMQLSCSAASK